MPRRKKSSRALTVAGMKAAIAEGFGRLGVDEVHVGTTVIKTKPPKNQRQMIRGYGDTVKLGDWFVDAADGWQIPMRLECVFEHGGLALVAHGYDREPGDGPTSMSMEGPLPKPWRRRLRLISEQDVAAVAAATVIGRGCHLLCSESVAIRFARDAVTNAEYLVRHHQSALDAARNQLALLYARWAKLPGVRKGSSASGRRTKELPKGTES